jgi:hypothetical protein
LKNAFKATDAHKAMNLLTEVAGFGEHHKARTYAQNTARSAWNLTALTNKTSNKMENNLSGCRGIINGFLIVAALAAIVFLILK